LGITDDVRKNIFNAWWMPWLKVVYQRCKLYRVCPSGIVYSYGSSFVTVNWDLNAQIEGSTQFPRSTAFGGGRFGTGSLGGEGVNPILTMMNSYPSMHYSRPKPIIGKEKEPIRRHHHSTSHQVIGLEAGLEKFMYHVLTG